MTSSDTNASINNLIGTFATINTGSYIPIPNNLVCIDTSNNRIGVNTIDPSYSIHVISSANNSDGIIASTGLIVSSDNQGTTRIILDNLPNVSSDSYNYDQLDEGQLYVDGGTLKIKLTDNI